MEEVGVAATEGATGVWSRGGERARRLPSAFAERFGVEGLLFAWEVVEMEGVLVELRRDLEITRDNWNQDDFSATE